MQLFLKIFEEKLPFIIMMRIPLGNHFKTAYKLFNKNILLYDIHHTMVSIMYFSLLKIYTDQGYISQKKPKKPPFLQDSFFGN
jgi:hypothetical protein